MGESTSRKLAVILHADVVGSTKLVRLNETLAHDRIHDTFQRFSETIRIYNGIPHEIRGDALLAEFARASDAVSASLAFQSANTTHNEELPDNIRPVIRVGIAMGEVVIADNTITGEGVVLAQRLEQLAQPGGICLQDAAYQTIPKRLPFHCENLGEREVKGFDEPVRVYAANLKTGATLPDPESLAEGDESPTKQSGKPSIAVLPFVNMSADPEQEYFADGMTEDIITALSNLSALRVIARNSTFAYKGKSVKVQNIADDLDVRYVLEGSVRTSAQRARITAQLVDATTGDHLWAERYDRELADIFEVQDEITRNIAIALQVQLSAGEHAQIWQGGTRNFEAWQYQMRGLQAYYKTTREGRREAAECFENALAIDPDYSAALTALGWAYSNFARYRETPDPETSLRQSEEIAEQLLKRKQTKSHGHSLLGQIRWMQGRREEAVAACAKAVELEPESPQHHGQLASILVYSEPEQALQHVNQAVQLSPLYPNWFTSSIFLAHYVQGNLETACQAASEAVERFPDYPFAWINLTGIYSALGRDAKARENAKKVLRMQPAFSLNEYAQLLGFQNSDDKDTWVSYLRNAGLPD
ncbi:MAG: adenylate/guanylate cyclase domain-containing protein [bacterium]